MLTHRNARLGLVGALVVLGGLGAAGLISYWWLLVPVALYFAAVAYGSATISSSFFIDTVCEAPNPGPAIALTFDDGPIPATLGILEILKKHEVPAAFFCIGRRVVEHPEILQQVVAQGHVVGNHSFSHHALLDFFPKQKLLAELEDTSQAIEQVIGRRPHLFRPPYGVTTPNLAYAIKQLGMACIGWNVRSLDTVVRDEQQLLAKMLTALKPGAVFLFHDSSTATAHMLDAFLQEAKSRGFSIIPPHQLLHETAYE